MQIFTVIYGLKQYIFCFSFLSSNDSILYCSGACFSKDPVTTGPDSLSGQLSGNFIGPEVVFLEAPVNSPGNYRSRKNDGPLPVSCVCLALVLRRWSTTWHDKFHFIRFRTNFSRRFSMWEDFFMFFEGHAIRPNLNFQFFDVQS